MTVVLAELVGEPRHELFWSLGSVASRAFTNLLPHMLQVSFLEKKVTELENDSLTSGDLKSKLKQENMQLVHRSGRGALLWGRGSCRRCQQRSLSLPGSE